MFLINNRKFFLKYFGGKWCLSICLVELIDCDIERIAFILFIIYFGIIYVWKYFFLLGLINRY